MTWLLDVYPWMKALHIIAGIAWMAGMLYLPRLFVYHCRAAPGSESAEMLKVMERRLLRRIINPAMIAVFVLGGLGVEDDLAHAASSWRLDRGTAEGPVALTAF